MQFQTTNTEPSSAYHCGVNHVNILQFYAPNKLQYFGFTIIFTKYGNFALHVITNAFTLVLCSDWCKFYDTA